MPEAAEGMGIGQLTRVPLRSVWKHEAHDFTKWMVDSIDEVGEAIGLRLEGAQSEQTTGNFSVDIVASLQDGSNIIIENQLEKSDHDHLGKLVTYLAAFDAKAAVWVVSEPRQEHINAVSWLNESGLADFFLLKVEAVKIGESSPAPLFTKIVGPSEEMSVVGDTKKELNASEKARIRFWKGLLAAGSGQAHPHSNISAGPYTYMPTGAGRAGLSYIHSVRKELSRIELYIDTGDGEINTKWFNELYSNKEQVEADFGDSLNWLALDDKRSCRIEYQINIGGLQDEEAWGEVHVSLIKNMVSFEKAMKPHISNLK